MKILAIGAHPDDIEIFMFGILYEFKKRGDVVDLCVATDGALGGKVYRNLVKFRKNESIEGLKKINKPNFLNLPDGYLGYEKSHKLKIEKFIEKKSPDLILTHYKKDYHTDHRKLSKLVNDIAGHYIPVLYCDTMLGINFEPNYYIDITKSFSFKKEAISKHISQKPHRFCELVELTNSYRAAQCNLPKGSYAEAYRFVKSFPFHDIRTILPESPPISIFDIDNPKGFL